MKTINFTETNGTQHTIRPANLNRVEVQDRYVRVAFPYEVLKFDMGSAKEAEKLYKTISAALAEA